MNYFYMIAVMILCITVVRFYYVNKEKKLFNTLNKMLDSAIDGNFTESMYDETMLSSVETRFNQYLLQCEVSCKNLNNEREKIKTLISDIAHQTKTPIANVVLYSELLCEQNLTDESKKCAQALSVQAEKLNFLISSLIKTSRLETGIIKINPQKNKVKDMLSQIELQAASKLKEKNTELNIYCGEEEAVFDPKWTMEALYNIIDNSIKYTKNNGKINVNVIPYNLFCRIDIEDNGIGISESEQCNIFKRFYRSEKVSEIEGVGIGLFLARKIISADGGYIKVKSEEGKGAEFSVFLPMEH